ncbi:hypothetical protein CEP52_010743 [Fusarium oligoseptatum]|uniref:Uncharacterized protein n=1 Tax=Fusarium oligoseptatum TaxID=2604345 RepID=A0A428T6R2_9HYPO|nr:hypothetical protein CEP52_010743 [Fusarium oligoseptatum]
MAPNPPSTNTDCLSRTTQCYYRTFTTILPFSDLLVELTLVDSTTGEGHTNASNCVNVNATQEKKNDKSSGN